MGGGVQRGWGGGVWSGLTGKPPPPVVSGENLRGVRGAARGGGGVCHKSLHFSSKMIQKKSILGGIGCNNILDTSQGGGGEGGGLA